uniref:Armadillo repeat-containing domain-containing protein n=1 Tax=Sphenodon punctatus TaxID=8508 RepID=A0A8D0HA22_SPHPU
MIILNTNTVCAQDRRSWLAWMKDCLGLVTPRNIAVAATGAGAVYLICKTIVTGIYSRPFSKGPVSLAHEETDHVDGKDSGELRRLLLSLATKPDDDSKRMILHSITRSVYLMESEASACTYEDLKLLASFLDDEDEGIKVQALNALKAFATIEKFKISIQEWIPMILELVMSIWNPELHIAGLRLLNGVPLHDHTYPLLRRLIPTLMKILSTGKTLAQVQTLKLLSILAQKEELLFDVLSCQVPSDFLNLFQTSQPGNLLFEILFFAEKLSEGRLSSQYELELWEFNELSLHEVLFGENSHLADRLLSLIMHQEEEVQMQACRVILNLQLYKEEEETSFDQPMDGTFFPDDETQYNI